MRLANILSAVVNICYQRWQKLRSSVFTAVRLHVCFPRHIWETDELKSPNLTYKCSTISSGNAFIWGSKGQGSRSWVTKTVPAWVFALFWVLASSSFDTVVLQWSVSPLGPMLFFIVVRRRPFAADQTPAADVPCMRTRRKPDNRRST